MKKIIYCTLALLTCIFLSSCKNQSSEIGLDLLDNLVGTDFMDTVTIEAYSVLEDTINTTNTSANILGHISDPIFGNSEAGIYTQFALSGSAVNFGENPILDSVVLTLQLSGYYGDTNSKVDIRVHELTESLNSETKYFQASTAAYNPTTLNYSTNGYTIRPNTTIVIDTGIYNAHLRIRLTQQFGQYLLNHQDELNNDLPSFLKGFYLEAVGHTGPRGYMLITSMTSALSGITLYYHNNRETNMHYTFSCNDNCVRFTHIDHDYSASNNSDFVQEVLQGQQQLGRKVLFIQGGGGVKTRITFPNLEKSFEKYNQRVAIHKAELVITNVDPQERYLIQPSNLTLQGISKSDSSIRFLPDDDYYTSVAYYGGTYNSSTREYRFRITQYIQQLILQQGDWSNSINLIVRGSAVRPARLVFDGTDISSPSRLRLEIYYSTF
jgi:hypothetical protein